jgi:raffinose/stachyose/melibiose transport system permease protein
MDQEKNKKDMSLRIFNMHIPSHIMLIIYSMIVILPLYIMITGSFKVRLEIFQNAFGFPESLYLANYEHVLSGGDFFLYFRNSFVVVGLSLFFLLVFGVMIAYALASWKSKFSNFLYFLFLAGMMIPLRMASIRLIEIIMALNLMGTFWGLIPTYVAMGLPIAIFVLTEFIRQIPKELTEAAIIDGAGRFRVMLNIVLPLTRPALAAVAIYNLIPFWNDLWFPMIYIGASREHNTLILSVFELFFQYKTEWPRVLALLTLASLPVLILYLLMSQQFIKGMTAGAVKE